MLHVIQKDKDVTFIQPVIRNIIEAPKVLMIIISSIIARAIYADWHSKESWLDYLPSFEC
jgi:hypothetical protein